MTIDLKGTTPLSTSTSSTVVFGAEGNSAANPSLYDLAAIAPTTTVSTVAAFKAHSFPSAVGAVRISGYYSAGVGGLTVRRVSSQPTHGWRFRSTDTYLPNGSTDVTNGGWWEGVCSDGCDMLPSQFGAIGDGTSHQLSSIFGTLGDAQAVYPCAVALTDEIDWCAW